MSSVRIIETTNTNLTQSGGIAYLNSEFEKIMIYTVIDFLLCLIVILSLLAFSSQIVFFRTYQFADDRTRQAFETQSANLRSRNRNRDTYMSYYEVRETKSVCVLVARSEETLSCMSEGGIC